MKRTREEWINFLKNLTGNDYKLLSMEAIQVIGFFADIVRREALTEACEAIFGYYKKLESAHDEPSASHVLIALSLVEEIDSKLEAVKREDEGKPK